jgi:hypothetical protein
MPSFESFHKHPNCLFPFPLEITLAKDETLITHLESLSAFNLLTGTDSAKKVVLQWASLEIMCNPLIRNQLILIFGLQPMAGSLKIKLGASTTFNIPFDDSAAYLYAYGEKNKEAWLKFENIPSNLALYFDLFKSALFSKTALEKSNSLGENDVKAVLRSRHGPYARIVKFIKEYRGIRIGTIGILQRVKNPTILYEFITVNETVFPILALEPPVIDIEPPVLKYKTLEDYVKTSQEISTKIWGTKNSSFSRQCKLSQNYAKFSKADCTKLYLLACLSKEEINLVKVPLHYRISSNASYTTHVTDVWMHHVKLPDKSVSLFSFFPLCCNFEYGVEHCTNSSQWNLSMYKNTSLWEFNIPFSDLDEVPMSY